MPYLPLRLLACFAFNLVRRRELSYLASKSIENGARLAPYGGSTIGAESLYGVLRLEREAFTAALDGKMLRLLEDRLLTRRTLRNEMVRAMQEGREFQFYRRGARLTPAHHATNPPPKW